MLTSGDEALTALGRYSIATPLVEPSSRNGRWLSPVYAWGQMSSLDCCNVLTQLIDNVSPFVIKGARASNVHYGGCTTKSMILVELSGWGEANSCSSRPSHQATLVSEDCVGLLSIGYEDSLIRVSRGLIKIKIYIISVSIHYKINDYSITNNYIPLQWIATDKGYLRLIH